MIQTLGKNYYEAVGKREWSKVEHALHPEVILKGPLGTVTGKESVLKATQGFMESVEHLEVSIVGIAEQDNQVFVLYTTDIPAIAKDFRAVSCLTFSQQAILSIELFYDSTAFQGKSYDDTQTDSKFGYS